MPSFADRITKKRSIPVPDAEWEALIALAQKHGTTASELVRNMIVDLLVENKAIDPRKLSAPVVQPLKKAVPSRLGPAKKGTTR